MKVKYYIFLLAILLSIPISAVCQVSINSTYRLTITGEPIIFQIQGTSPQDSTFGILPGDYSSVSTAKVALNQFKSQGYTDAYIIETTLPKSVALQRGITLNASLFEQATSSSLSQSTTPLLQLWQNATSFFSSSSSSITVNNLAELIKRFPNNAKIGIAKYYLGTLYYGRYWSRHNKNIDEPGQWENLRAATQLFQDIVTNYSSDTIAKNAQLQLAYCKQAMARWGINRLDKENQAKQEFQNYLSMDNDSNSPLWAEGQTQYAAKTFESALNNLTSWDTVQRELTKLMNDTTHTISHGQRARCSLMYSETFFYQGDTSNLIISLRNHLSQYADCPYENAMGKYWLARATIDQGQWSLGLNQLNELVTNYSQSTEWYSPRLMSAVLFCQARAYEGLNNPTQAQTLYQQIIQRYPNSWEAKVSTGRVNQ